MKPRVSGNRSILAKARKVLAFAQDLAPRASNRSELFNAVFGPGAKAAEFFSTESDRRAFWKTKERRQIWELINTLPPGPKLDEVYEIDVFSGKAVKRGRSKTA